LNLAIVQRYVDEIRTVSDEAIIEALRALALQAKLVVEPGGAAGVAALMSDSAIERPAAVVLSGSNVDGSRLATWLA
jgi:threonine dehydratase